MLMKSNIIVFIKLMSAAISSHWTVSPEGTTLRDPGTSGDYDVLVRQAISMATASANIYTCLVLVGLHTYRPKGTHYLPCVK